MKINLKNFINKLLGKKEIPPYPIPFGLILLTSEASERGIRDNENKIIVVYQYNIFGNLDKKIYAYSEQRVHALEKLRKIPIHDKTQKEDRFPVYSTASPQEISYTTK